MSKDPLSPEDRERSHEKWTLEEHELLLSYFDSTWTPLTLYIKLNQLNPNRSYESVSRAIRRMREKKGYLRPRERALDKLRIGYFDIESTDLDCEFGNVVCWCIKAKGVDRIDSACWTRKEATSWEHRDKRMMAELLEAFKKYDVLYTHYGEDRRFDYPMIRSRAMYWGMDDKLPVQGEAYIFDTWKIARNKLRMKSNRLDRIAKFFHIEVEKTYLDPEIWAAVRIGKQSAIDYVYDHCQKDVLVLEKVHERLKCVERPIYRSV